MIKILAIVVTYNGMEWIDRCLDSLLCSTLRPDVFVVDNGSTDGTQEYIRGHFPKVIFRQNETNLGFGQANNIGLRFALEGDYSHVYLMNQDAWVEPDTIEKLANLSERFPEYGVLSPFQMESGGIRMDRRFIFNVCHRNLELMDDLYSGELKEIYPVPNIMAAHWLLTRKAIETVGGFSPSFPHYGEDANYADRLKFRGLKLGIAPGSKAVHDRGDRVNSNKKEIYISAMNLISEISVPSRRSAFALSHAFKRLCIDDVLAYHSLRPIHWFFYILFHYPSILRNKRVSEKESTAFLYS